MHRFSRLFGSSLGNRAVIGAGTSILALGTTAHWYLNKDTPTTKPKTSWFSLDWLSSSLSEPALDIFLPPPALDSFGNPPRTIVVAFEGLLVDTAWNRETGWIITKRPGADAFLRRLAQLGYEVVLFSGNYEGIMQPVLDNFDRRHVASYRLFRECLLFRDGKYIKDLSRLNRDLSRVVVVETDEDALCLQPDNAVFVGSWAKGQGNSHELLELLPFLESLVKDDVRDVREVIRGYGSRGIAEKFLAHTQQVNEMLMEERKQNRPRTGSWFGGSAKMLQKPVNQLSSDPFK